MLKVHRTEIEHTSEMEWQGPAFWVSGRSGHNHTFTFDFHLCTVMSINHEQDGDISLTSSHVASRPRHSPPTQAESSSKAKHPLLPGPASPLIADDTIQRMRRWVYDIVVCNFDLETGPVIDRSVLRPLRGKREKENL